MRLPPYPEGPETGREKRIREAMEKFEKRQRDELKQVDNALKDLAEDHQRDDLIKKAVASIQLAKVPTVVKIDKAEVVIGEGGKTLEDVKSVVEGQLAQSRKPGNPPWLPILWESLLESIEVKLKISISMSPIEFFSIDAVKFVKLVKKRLAERK